MIIGEVIGNVWATRKNEKLNGLKFMVVKINHPNQAETIVAADNVGAGIGDTVLVTTGSAARVAFDSMSHIPTDATIIGIIDEVEVQEE